MSGGEIAVLVLFGGGGLVGLAVLPGFWVGRGRGGAIEQNWAAGFRDERQSRLRAMRSFPVGVFAMLSGVVGWAIGADSQSETVRALSTTPFLFFFVTYWVIYYSGRPQWLVPPRYRDKSQSRR